jgi:hypothetical protein
MADGRHSVGWIRVSFLSATALLQYNKVESAGQSREERSRRGGGGWVKKTKVPLFVLSRIISVEWETGAELMSELKTGKQCHAEGQRRLFRPFYCSARWQIIFWPCNKTRGEKVTRAWRTKPRKSPDAVFCCLLCCATKIGLAQHVFLPEPSSSWKTNM